MQGKKGYIFLFLLLLVAPVVSAAPQACRGNGMKLMYDCPSSVEQGSDASIHLYDGNGNVDIVKVGAYYGSNLILNTTDDAFISLTDAEPPYKDYYFNAQNQKGSFLTNSGSCHCRVEITAPQDVAPSETNLVVPAEAKTDQETSVTAGSEFPGGVDEKSSIRLEYEGYEDITKYCTQDQSCQVSGDSCSCDFSVTFTEIGKASVTATAYQDSLAAKKSVKTIDIYESGYCDNDGDNFYGDEEIRRYHNGIDYTYKDSDGSATSCVDFTTAPGNYIGDCDDADDNTYPGAEEVCDGERNDCTSGQADIGCDSDHDGYIDANMECYDGALCINDAGADVSLLTPCIAECAGGYGTDCVDDPADDVDPPDGSTFECPTQADDCESEIPELAGCAICIHPDATNYCDEPYLSTTIDSQCKGADFDQDSSACDNLLKDYDQDADGYIALDAPEHIAVWMISKDFMEGDCNDRPPGGQYVNPDRAEICDGVDNDCDNLVDEGCDSDHDGYLDPDMVIRYDSGLPIQCANDTGDTLPAEQLASGSCHNLQGNPKDLLIDGVNHDNSDTGAAIYPDAPEDCDGKDNNGKNGIDEGCDKDSDGYLAAGRTCVKNWVGKDYISADGIGRNCAGKEYDPDDDDPQEFPGALWYYDSDGDGYYSISNEDQRGPEGEPDDWTDQSLPGGDCIEEPADCSIYSDSNARTYCENNPAKINPGAMEFCNGVDDNCNKDSFGSQAKQANYIDEGWQNFTGRQLNTNQEGVCLQSMRKCENGMWVDWYDAENDGPYMSHFQEKEDICDGRDNDCDGLTDETFDKDGDGYTQCGTRSGKIASVAVQATEQSFCKDAQQGAGSGEACTSSQYPNWDRDDTNRIASDPSSCPKSPSGCTISDTFCAVCRFPYAEEYCDGISTDFVNNPNKENEAEICESFKNDYDEDGDGFCKPGTPVEYLERSDVCYKSAAFIQDGYAPSEVIDCNDNDETIKPDQPEICDGIDNNCNTYDGGWTHDLDASTGVDEGCDSDQDGYIDATMDCVEGTNVWCTDDAGNTVDCNALCEALDCDDNPNDGELVYPGADEQCTATRDFNCDGTTFEDRGENACISTYPGGQCDYLIEEHGIVCKGKFTENETASLDYWGPCGCDPYIEIVSPKNGEYYDNVAPLLDIDTNLYSMSGVPLASYRLNQGAIMNYYQENPFAIKETMPDDRTMKITAFFKRENTKVLGKTLGETITLTYIKPIRLEEEALEAKELNTSEVTDEDTQIFVDEFKDSTISKLHNTNTTTTREDIDSVLDKKLTTNLYQGRTEVSLGLSSKKKLQGTSVLLEIPKCAAELVNEMEFENSNYEILKEDPLIAWHFTELDSDVELRYEFKKELDEDCLEQLKVLSLVDEIGADTGSDFVSSPLFALILIPVVASVLIYFSKFTTKSAGPSGKVEGDVSSELARSIETRLGNGQDYEQIESDFMQDGFSQDDIKKAFEEASKVQR